MDQNRYFWIDIEFGDEDVATFKLVKALSACKKVHEWTVEVLNSYWSVYLRMPKYREFRKDLSRYIAENRLLNKTQQYSLYKAAEQTFPYVASQISVNEKWEATPASPLKEYKEIQIKSRKIWKRYLANDYGITTTYGTIFPVGDWKNVVREQAGEIPLDLVPFLWHSISVWNSRKGWKMRFNMNNPDSKAGKRAIKEMRKEYEPNK